MAGMAVRARRYARADARSPSRRVTRGAALRTGRVRVRATPPSHARAAAIHLAAPPRPRDPARARAQGVPKLDMGSMPPTDTHSRQPSHAHGAEGHEPKDAAGPEPRPQGAPTIKKGAVGSIRSQIEQRLCGAARLGARHVPRRPTRPPGSPYFAPSARPPALTVRVSALRASRARAIPTGATRPRAAARPRAASRLCATGVSRSTRSRASSPAAACSAATQLADARRRRRHLPAGPATAARPRSALPPSPMSSRRPSRRSCMCSTPPGSRRSRRPRCSRRSRTASACGRQLAPRAPDAPSHGRLAGRPCRSSRLCLELFCRSGRVRVRTRTGLVFGPAAAEWVGAVDGSPLSPRGVLRICWVRHRGPSSRRTTRITFSGRTGAMFHCSSGQFGPYR